MPDGGTMTVQTWASPELDHVYLSVKDTGTGIDPEFHDKIFLPFFTTKDINEGTGLGLAVVHGIVSSHGGSIRMESRPGHGSCFVVCLPVRPTGQPSEPTEEGKDAQA
jgi:signal transduction histidine kinase